ncbi:MAG: hypothetical protein OEV06_12825, partial [Anaerolineae bacterium]|nr:hypothetical protein [Anaerolineae bacterium]
MLEKSLVNPMAMAPYLRFTRKQRMTLQGLALLGPVQVGILASFLGRDRSNVFHTLKGLVSLGLVVRERRGRN